MLNKKILKFIIGTNNKGKLREIRGLLPKNLEIYSPSDFKIKSPIENRKSFLEIYTVFKNFGVVTRRNELPLQALGISRFDLSEKDYKFLYNVTLKEILEKP